MSGLLLLADHRTPAALAWALMLCGVFTVCTSQAWLRGLPNACGCLDLRLLGLRPDSGVGGLLESVAFACLRAAALAGAASFLLVNALKSPSSPPDPEFQPSRPATGRTASLHHTCL